MGPPAFAGTTLAVVLVISFPVVPAKAGTHGDRLTMERHYYVYVLASQKNGTLYIGVTGNLAKRVWEHSEGLGGDFTRRYRVRRLVHVDTFGDANAAIAREKAMKKWRRAWKIDLIERDNPDWDDLYLRLN